MAKHGKRYRQVAEKIEGGQRYLFQDAVNLVLETASAKFDETLDAAVQLGVNPRHADQMVRGAVVLPNGLGKTVRVLVFAKGEKEQEAREAGADIVGAEELIAKIQGGWLEFDTVVATPDMMGHVGRLGKVLGPRGLMPTPKTGTVTFDLARAIRDIRSGKVDYKVEKAGIVHAPVGKASFEADKLKLNFLWPLAAIIAALSPQKAFGGR